MSAHDASRHDGPVLLSNLLDGALTDLSSGQEQSPASDGFLYSGNRHESVPRRLFLDRRLTPLERNAWQVFRLQLNADAVTAFPTYEQLRPFLAAMPCGPKASFETIARALTLLRLTRWLSLVRRRRDAQTGRIQGNLYVLHDEPLTPWEAMQLDPEYLGLVSQALGHASKAVQRVGCHTLQEITVDPMIAGRSLPTRLQVLAQRMANQGWVTDSEPSTEEPLTAAQNTACSSYPQTQGAHESEAGRGRSLRNAADLISESVVGRKAAENGTLPNPKQDRTVRGTSISEVRTVLAEGGHPRLRLPERFTRLQTEQQHGALAALHKVDLALQQPVLDEWNARCQRSTVRNPAGYLFGIIQKALHGEFKAWAGKQQEPRSSQPSEGIQTLSNPITPAEPEAVQQHIARLRDLLSIK